MYLVAQGARTGDVASPTRLVGDVGKENKPGLKIGYLKCFGNPLKEKLSASLWV